VKESHREQCRANKRYEKEISKTCGPHPANLGGCLSRTIH
jgi:hypothetical protein